MALTQFHQGTFKTIQRAFANSQVALMECRLRATGEMVAVICGVYPLGRGESVFIPLAQLFPGNPYDTIEPPVNG
jgi:Family of unknown function (DUF6117)